MFIVSTTGDGDPPDTVTKFWRRLRKKTLDSSYLKNVRFALLGWYMLKNPIHTKYPPELSVYYPDQNIDGTLGHLIIFSAIVAKLK